MRLRQFEDPTTFLRKVEPWLLKQEAANCLLLDQLAYLVENPLAAYDVALFKAENDRAQTIGVSSLISGEPIFLSEHESEVVSNLAESLRQKKITPAGIVGPTKVAQAFAHVWSNMGEKPFQLKMRQNVYRCSKVRGEWDRLDQSLVQAAVKDRELLIDWSNRFIEDCGLDSQRSEIVRAVDRALNRKNRYLLFDQSEPVAMAGFSGKTRNGIRINWVYVPPRKRRQGFGKLVSAMLTQYLLNEGNRFCFLIADANNPTTNALYQNVGYEMVCEMLYFVTT